MPNALAKVVTQILLIILALSHPNIAAAQNPPDPQSTLGRTRPKRSRAPAALLTASRKKQADAILAELRQIRQLLEKQQMQFARGAGPQPYAPPPPQKVQMNVDDGWYFTGRADAPVTLVEFADFQCASCKRFNTDAYAELKKSYIDTGKSAP